MIAIDTSIWIDALRNEASPEGRGLHLLLGRDLVALPAPVRVEILTGASSREQKKLRALLSALPTWAPDADTWQRIDDWLPVAAAAGDRFGFADLLIAALTAQRHAKLWTLDTDFQRMERHGWIRLYSTEE